MNDVSIEWISPVGESTRHKTWKWLFLIIAVAAVVYSAIFWIIFLLIVAAGFFVLFIFFMFFAYKDFAFVLIDTDMRIARVYNRTRRKPMLQFDLKEVNSMVHGVEPEDKLIYYCNPKGDGDKYTLTVTRGIETKYIVIEPEPEFVDLMDRKYHVLKPAIGQS